MTSLTRRSNHGQIRPLKVHPPPLDRHSADVVALPTNETMQKAVGQRAIGRSTIGVVGASPSLEVEVVDQRGDLQAGREMVPAIR
jgi:hypothetical protein